MHENGDWVTVGAIRHSKLAKLKEVASIWNTRPWSNGFLQQIEGIRSLRIEKSPVNLYGNNHDQQVARDCFHESLLHAQYAGHPLKVSTASHRCMVTSVHAGTRPPHSLSLRSPNGFSARRG